MTIFEMNNKIEEAFNPTMDKYAMYLRKSRADLEAEKDGEGETLARHKKILTDLAVRKGLYVEKIYEEVVSGETIEARKEIQKLIQDCYAGKYKGIIVIDISRLSRGNQGDAQTILDCLKFSNMNRGVLVVTPSKTYDIAHNHDDEEYMEFELFMSRREYKMIKRRLDRGKAQAVVEGNYMGGIRPYGYNIVKKKRTRTLEPNPNEAPYVKMIFDWAVNENISPAKIAVRLNNMGVPSYKGQIWVHSTIRNILMNYTYAGKVVWFERVKVKTMGDDGTIKTKMSRFPDHFAIYDGKHEGLVDIETFETARQRYPRHRTNRNQRLVNPLASLVHCSKCGRSLRFKPDTNGKVRYSHVYNTDCFIKSITAADIMNAFIYALKLYIEDFELKIDNKPEVNENSVSHQLNALRQELKRIEQKKTKLFDGWEDGKITDNEFVERKAIATQQIETINDQIFELENTIPEQEEFREKLMTLHQALEMIPNERIEAIDKNNFLKSFVSKIEVSRENDYEFILDVTLH